MAVGDLPQIASSAYSTAVFSPENLVRDNVIWLTVRSDRLSLIGR